MKSGFDMLAQQQFAVLHTLLATIIWMYSESTRQVPTHCTPDAIYVLQAKLLYEKLASDDVSQPEIQS